MKRINLIIAAIILATAGMASESRQQVDFALFDTALPIGDGAIEPRPGADETLLIQFWASWCHSCGSLMWDMDEIVSRNDGVRYVAVSIDDDVDAARVYIRKHRLFEKYSDRYFVDSEKAFAASLDITTVPTILLVNSRGEVLVRKSGHLNAADFQEFARAMRHAP